MFSRLCKTPKSSLQLFREQCAETCQMHEGCRQLSAETFSSLPIIRKVGLEREGVGVEVKVSGAIERSEIAEGLREQWNWQ